MLHWRGEGEVARGIRLRHFAEVSRSVDDVIDLMGSLMRYGRNMEIFGEDEPADYLYKVVRRRRSHRQAHERWAPADQRLLPAGRHVWARDRRRCIAIRRSRSATAKS